MLAKRFMSAINRRKASQKIEKKSPRPEKATKILSSTFAIIEKLV